MHKKYQVDTEFKLYPTAGQNCELLTVHINPYNGRVFIDTVLPNVRQIVKDAIGVSTPSLAVLELLDRSCDTAASALYRSD